MLCKDFSPAAALRLLTAAAPLGECGLWGVRALERGLSSCGAGLSSSRPVPSSQVAHQTHVSCIGRWILTHWASTGAPVGTRLAHQDLNFPACELGRGHFLCSQLPTRDRPLWDWGWQQPSQGACSRVLGRLRELHCGQSLPCPSCQTPHSTFAEFTGRSPRPCLAAPGCGWARCLRPLPDGPASGQSRHGMGKWLKGLEDT